MIREDKLTLDTNVIYEWWERRKNHAVVAQLLALADSGGCDLAVTASIHADIFHDPLAKRVASLPELGIELQGTVARSGSWVLGRDMLGMTDFADWHEGLNVASPDRRDFDHLHAHMLLKRDYFLTWDGAILELGPELESNWGIRVLQPEKYLGLPRTRRA